ncbi:N-acetylmuramoyl-L-alanine amidase [Archangium primigenium]|uniref:N-acetylmuramoyl-L-alanine amidase n=1 Tax=[Archangium] primigenium TaxID=2792470 RepID=UPI00195CDB86|nr:N-acetylmuramoyl-L-alanine amidase [Archangium primigenium]MBM7114855.1 N-acetylmuramoyl-L-alanine amidase [Archangium primigenium]
MRIKSGWVVLGASLALACGANEQPGPEVSTEAVQGPRSEEAAREDASLDVLFREAGSEFNVPPALLKGLAFVQTRYEMVQGAQEFEGRPALFGVMALGGPLLEEGARLADVSVAEAQGDARANIRAAAALLSHHADALRVDRSHASQWAPALEAVSGIADAAGRRAFVQDELFRSLRLGLGTLSREWDATGQSLAAEPDTGGRVRTFAAGPDYPASVWRASPNYNARPIGVRMVIIHTCESSYAGCWSWLTNPSSEVSAHYVVREDGGEISQLVRESSRGWHIGATYQCSNNGNQECGLNGRSANDFTIGIEHGGYASTKNWPVGQIDASARLLCDITRDHKIPRDRYHIVGHGQLQPYNRTDPGANWPWTDYLNRANAHCGAGCSVGGAILTRYNQLGGAGGVLGGCMTSELTTPDGVGRFNHFQNGSIYWTPDTGAWEVYGNIRNRWEALDWEKGVLGYPISGEKPTPDGVGRFNHFQKGSIYWTQATGAWEVHGLIRAKWEALGWETSALGYPITGEQKTPDGVGRYNHFKKGAIEGSIYWTPTTGAWEVHGRIREKWAALGWEKSTLGYPVSDEYAVTGGRESEFQKGFLTYTAATDTVTVRMK